MREKHGRIITFLSAGMLIGICVFCISATVYSSEKITRRDRENCYKEMEAAYVKEIRSFLDEEGYSNSGVMMTKIIDENEHRAYTVTIHHRNLLIMEQEKQEQLTTSLTQLFFGMENCTVEYQFM